ncbi:hypothetical protein FACS1894164_14960 [Spirochaetia bacterium]|nr:hypothetical protein FACS1894164_14960 [Spirochaetia bacterium]
MATLPTIVRARAFYVYTDKGRRLLDLWQAGGKALLGHKPAFMVRELKNAAERGLFSPFPHPAEGRFRKALGQLFPGKEFRYFSNMERLQTALQKAGFPDPCADPAYRKPDSHVSLWRPFVEEPNTRILIPVLPCPFGPAVAAFDPEIPFPESDSIAPFILVATTRSLYDFFAVAPDREKVHYNKIEKALTESHWHRRGLYLHYESGNYETLFSTFLAENFLLAPDPDQPLILPPGLSPGEEKKLAQLISTG